MSLIEEAAKKHAGSSDFLIDPVIDRIANRYLEAWEAEAGLKTYGDAIASVMAFRIAEGEKFDMNVAEWQAFSRKASFYAAREKARSLGIHVIWDCELAKTPEGYYQVRKGIDFAIARSRAVAPFADLLWMETKTANLDDAKEFAEAIHAEFPDKMLAYNLSPSFNWDTTGMSDEQMRRFPEELGRLGYVFNFITYGGHQIDGLAGEDFSASLRHDGMLALARLQRKFRLIESPYKTPQTLVGGPRLDGALMASTGRTATTKAMGKGSTQIQHLIQTEVPTSLLGEWLAFWVAFYGLGVTLRIHLKPHTPGSEVLELAVIDGDGEKMANVVFANIHDRRDRSILSVRDQNTFSEKLRKKRLMTLVHLFLIHRYKAASVHYVGPTEDNIYQTRKMKSHGIYSDVHSEVGQIIVAQVNRERIAELLEPDGTALKRLIDKTGPPPD
jgi:isocitrate lyase